MCFVPLLIFRLLFSWILSLEYPKPVSVFLSLDNVLPRSDYMWWEMESCGLCILEKNPRLKKILSPWLICRAYTLLSYGSSGFWLNLLQWDQGYDSNLFFQEKWMSHHHTIPQVPASHLEIVCNWCWETSDGSFYSIRLKVQFWGLGQLFVFFFFLQ